MSARNSVKLVGRLTKDPMIFQNQDGSRKIMATLAVKDNFYSTDTNGDRIIKTNFLNIEQFISKKRTNNGAWQYCGKGDQIAIEGELHSSTFTDANGNRQFPTVISITDLALLDSKADTTARRGQVAEPAAQSMAQPMPQPAPQYVPAAPQQMQQMPTQYMPAPQFNPYGE